MGKTFNSLFMKVLCIECESEKVELTPELRFHCLDCGRLFDGEDIQREMLRRRLSPLLSGTSEENPMKVSSVIIGEEEACGLSSLELPEIEEVFLFEDGTMWFHIYGEIEADGTKAWEDIDKLSIKELWDLVEAVIATRSEVLFFPPEESVKCEDSLRGR